MMNRSAPGGSHHQSSHLNASFTHFFPSPATMDENQSVQQNRNINKFYHGRMSAIQSAGQFSLSSHFYPPQNSNIPDEFRQSPAPRYGEQLGIASEGPGRSPCTVHMMRQTDEHLRNTIFKEEASQEPDLDDVDILVEELLQDVEIDSKDENLVRDRNSNSTHFTAQTTVKTEQAQVSDVDLEETRSASCQPGLFSLHSEIDIKEDPEPEAERRPCLSIRKDLFQSNHPLQQPNVMSHCLEQGGRGRYSRSQRGDGVPLFDDPSLPPGWYRTVSQRKSGATAGGWDTYIFSPPQYGAKRFRSKQEIRRYFEKTGEMYLDWRDFDFNPFGSKGQQEMQALAGGQASEDRTRPTQEIEFKPDITSLLSCHLKQEMDETFTS